MGYFDDIDVDGALKSLAAKAPPEPGDFVRGFKESFQQLPQLGYGLVAGAGAALEKATGKGGIATGIKRAGVQGYQEWGDKIAANAKESDSWNFAWDEAKGGNFGALVDWLQHGIGYAAGQGVQIIGTGVVGGLVGKVGLQGAARTLADGMVRKEAGRIAATEAGAKLTADQLSRAATANVASKLGQTAAVGAQAFGMEGGEIFGGLVQQAEREGRELSGADLGRALGATVAAGALEFVGDKFGLDVMLGRSALAKRAMSAAGKATGIGGRAARGALGAGVVMPAEGATEYFQTGLEEYGKGTEASALPWEQSAENQRQAIDAAAQGAVGGGVMGVGAGLLTRARQRQADRALQGFQKAGSVDEMAQAAIAATDTPLDVGLSESQEAAALGRLDQQRMRDEAALRQMDERSAVAPERQPSPAVVVAGRLPVGDATELLPTGEATEVEQLPVGEVAELVPTADAVEVPKRIPVGQASEIDVETIQPGDLLTSDGEPYGTRSSAVARASREGGGDVVKVQGGFVVRKENTGEPVGNVAGSADVAAAPSDGRGDQPDGGGGVVRPDAAALQRVDRGPEAAAAGGVADQPMADAGVANPALTEPLAQRVAAARQPADAGALVKVRTMFGTNTYVQRADLDGATAVLKAFTSTGKRNGRIHRENLDPDGAKQAARNAEDATNPLFDVVGTTQGTAFQTAEAAARERSVRGLKESHDIVPMRGGFAVVRKKQPIGHVSPDTETQELDSAAHQAATSPKNDLPEPTDAQKEAGNYRKGHYTLNGGLDVAIENPAGSVRRSKDGDKNPWQVVMPYHYGYVKGTVGVDKDHVDIAIGPRGDNGRYWVINQDKPDSNELDEHKVITGVESAVEAIKLYKSGFADGFGDKVFGSVSREFGVDDLKQTLPEMGKKVRVAGPGQVEAAVGEPAVASERSGGAPATEPEPAAQRREPDQRSPEDKRLVELRRRLSVLKALRECLTK